MTEDPDYRPVYITCDDPKMLGPLVTAFLTQLREEAFEEAVRQKERAP